MFIIYFIFPPIYNYEFHLVQNLSVILFISFTQGLREGDETEADHRGPRWLGKIRGPPLYRKKKRFGVRFWYFLLTLKNIHI